MPRDYVALKERLSIAAVIGAYIKLKKIGSEYSCQCPFHADATPSMRVYDDHAHCYGCGWHGDVFDFVEKHEGISHEDAYEFLTSGKFALAAEVTNAAIKKQAPEWLSFQPPLDNKSPQSFAIAALGEAVNTWSYLDTKGDVLGWVARYKPPELDKTFRQWTWGHMDNEAGKPLYWAARHFSKPRPLYGLDRLGQAPADRQVLVVEGEKAADAAQILFPVMVVLSWPGGANAISLADWEPIYGRRVLVVPDHDAPGRTAAHWLCALLHSHACQVVLIDPEPTLPPSWDLADALEEEWTPQHALKWARERKRAWPLVPVDAAPAPDTVVPFTAPSRPPLAVVGGTDAGDAKVAAPPLPEVAKFSDRQMSLRFIALHGQDWRFTEEESVWRRWTGNVWGLDRTKGIMHAVAECLSGAAREDGGATLTTSQITSLESDAKASAVSRSVAYHPQIAVPFSRWDQDDFVLATPGGVVMLESGNMRPAVRHDYCTRIAGCAPADTIDAPVFSRWIQDVTKGDHELQDFLQRWCGYCLTGSYKEQIFVYLYGGGGNGKGVFSRLIFKMLGEYAKVPTMDEFVESPMSRHSTELYSILLARVACVDEGKQNQRMDTAKVKWITGGTHISARQIGQDPEQHKPKCKLIFQSNYKPSLRSIDDGIRRRFKLVPFGYKIPRIDTTFEDQLGRELPSILRWAIDGCLRWQREGLNSPRSIADATADYLRTEDVIGSWLEDCCRLEPVESCLYQDAYRSYASYCERANERPWAAKRFKEAVTARSIDIEKSGSAIWLRGLTFTEAEAARVAIPITGYGKRLEDF